MSQTLSSITPKLSPQWLLLGALLLALYVPTYITLSEEVWSQEGQGHGSVILALTLWLLWQRWNSAHDTTQTPGANLCGGVLIALALPMYVIGESQAFPEFSTFSQILLLGGLILVYSGWKGLRHYWFPLFFMLFLVPLPGSIVQAITAPLKMAVSVVAESILFQAGYPIGRTGVTLTIGQYQLLVADACAGLNSIFALEAIGVFYLSLANYTNKLRNILIAIFILPISFVSNVTRVIVLVLVTYYFGDEAGQGFVHQFAGIFLFMIATILTVGLDAILSLFFKNAPKAS